MAQPKGKTGNPNGRPKGSPNKITSELKTWVKMLIDNNRQGLEQDFKKLSPKDRWQIIERLLAFCVPKMQSTEAVLDLQRLTDAELETIINQITSNEDENNGTDAV